MYYTLLACIAALANFPTSYSNSKEACQTNRYMFKCATGTACFQRNKICDGARDCADGSDEATCGRYNNQDAYHNHAEYFRCDNGVIHFLSSFCNGVKDCTDGSDEAYCTCHLYQFKCSTNSLNCIDLKMLCDGKRDCPDGSDEYSSVCRISMGEPAGSYLPHDLGDELDVWTKKSDGTPAAAEVWPENPVYFPDFSKNSTKTWWTTIMKEFVKLVPYSGIWIDMNEPVSFVTGDYFEGCETNTLNNPPYIPQIVGGDLANKTLCPDHVDSVSTHYNTHNLYGWFQAEDTYLALQEAIPGERPFVLTRATFLGTGNWAAHWIGDNYSFWSNLKTSIIGMLQFNQFGIPFVGADICGFQYNTTVQLCQRWHQLGAFYPFSRNHNGGIALQDPAVLGPVVAESARKHLEIRYTMLPYLYTLFYYHMTGGNTVARALWHEFPTDEKTHSVDTQFLLGQGFMVSPVVEENTTTKNIYFPDARWYSYYDGSEVETRGSEVTVAAPLDFLPLHVQGGLVYPTQEHAMNTELARKNPIGLIVTMSDENTAEGRMYYDDGVSIDSYVSGRYYLVKYTYANGTLESVVENDGYPRMASLKLQTIRLFGSKNISKATISLNGVELENNIQLTKLVSGEVQLSELNLVANQPFKILFE